MNLSRPIRILHVFGGMNCGGAETFVMNVYRHLDRTQVQFDFLVHTSEACYYDEEIKRLGGRIFAIKAPQEAGIANYLGSLKKLLAEQGVFHGVHSHIHLFSGLVLRQAAKARIPVRIAHSHCVDDGGKQSLLRGIYTSVMKRLITRYANRQIGCSEAACIALYGASGNKKNRISVIRNAIDASCYEENSSEPKGAIKASLQLAEDAVVVGHVGRFADVKNHFFLIDIFKQLLLEVPHAHLLLIGDGELRHDIETYIQRLQLEKQVHCLGVRSDIPRLLQALDVFVFPSKHEGLGISLIEAQAAGVPCVISDTIPAEAALIDQLIITRRLSDSPNEWVQSMLQALDQEKLGWQQRLAAIQDNGYRIQDTASQLVQMYTNA